MVGSQATKSAVAWKLIASLVEFGKPSETLVSGFVGTK